MKKHFVVFFLLSFSFIFSFSTPVHAASAPFSDSFDTYSLGNVYAQGLWQNKANAWDVTTQGCYGSSGQCITSTGLSDTTSKTGTPLTTGEWRIRFKVASMLGQNQGVTIAFGTAANPMIANFEINDDTNSFPTKLVVSDDVGTFTQGGLVLNTWHTLVYKWDMSNTSHCTFTVSIDGGLDRPTSPSYNATNCYASVFPDHQISTLALSTYYTSPHYGPDYRVEIDDIGDGPTIDGCTANCSGTPPSQVTDSFDHFNDQGWAPVRALTTQQPLPFAFDDNSTGDCYSGGCLKLTTSTGFIYRESGVGKGTGAFTIWARAYSALGVNGAQGSIGLCTAAWSNCFPTLSALVKTTLLPDNQWHQYYISWRQGASFLETCWLMDDTDSTHCAWTPTTFAAGTQIDGVQLFGSTSVAGSVVWFDELMVPPPTTTLSLSGTQGLNGWYTSNVTASLVASDGGSGPIVTYYSLDGAATTTSVGPNTTILVTTEGVHTLSYYSVDTTTGGIEKLRSATFKIDKTSPVTALSLSGTAGLHGWYISNVAATLTPSDTVSSVTTTYYSIDGAPTTTVVGQAGAPVFVTTEGIHTLSYYSVDAAGNSETPTSISIKIDQTAPEVSMGASTSTQDLDVVGIDNLSSTTVTKTGDMVTVADQAGNTTTLDFCKTYSGHVLTYAHLKSIQYGGAAPISLPTSFLFVWNVLKNPPSLLSQTVVADPVYGIEALFSRSKNRTTVALLQRNQKIQTSTVVGLAIVKLTTNKGTMQYSW